MIGAEAVAERQVLTVPYEIAWQGDIPLVVLAEIGSDKIHATFWNTALEKSAKRVSIIKLDDVVIDSISARFIGAIHHITRCGSTTLLQQFGALDRTFALSEPFIFLELLGRSSADQSRTAMRIKKLVYLFANGLAAVADKIVVKWPTIACRHAPMLNRALRDVPSVLIVRDAVEVLASIEAKPLGSMRHIAPDLLRGPDGLAAHTSVTTELARTAILLAANCRWIAQSRHMHWMDYTQLPDVGWQHVAPMFGITPNTGDIARMQQVSAINAKQPRTAFVSDTAEKRRDASPVAQSLANDILQPAIDEACAALKSF